MNDRIKNQFDQAAARYDSERRGLIPCFDEFYGAAVRWTELSAARPRILDLGAGTGLLSAMLLAKYPDAELTLIDFSEDMLDRAKARFAGRQPVRYIVADYSDCRFPHKFDAVVSSLSIHHLPHERKQALFRTVRDSLEPGGLFVNADQTAGASPAIDDRYNELWLEAVSRSGLTAEAIDASRERRRLDINAGLAEQLQWLRDAGFAHADCVYKHNEFTVYVAVA